MLDEALGRYRTRVADALVRWLPDPGTPPRRLHEAMRYATLNGGKRLRAALVYGTGECLDADPGSLDAPACAVELIHSYSLVHDDLPAMDDDELRRGMPTCHRAFDEATAILAGDALQALAFHILAEDPSLRTDPSLRLQMVGTLATAAGYQGMAGGQAIDLESVGRELTLPELENMHIHKTGALIRAAVRLGLFAAGGAPAQVADGLDHYAKCLGLAFQIQDDVLDVEGSTEVMGKAAGADRHRNKPTYPSLLGVSESRREARVLAEDGIASLAPLGERGAFLRELAHYAVERTR